MTTPDPSSPRTSYDAGPPPGWQAPIPWQERVRRSSALIPGLALLLLVVVGLAGAMVARHVDDGAATGPFGAHAQAGAPAAFQPVAPGAAPVVVSPQARADTAPVRAQRPVQAPVVASSRQVCTTCGTVESVRALTRKGEASGVGVVTGGLVGGLLGSQIGGGSGKTVATIAGVVGGGYAGNEVEKHVKRTTVYQVRVRMDDGSIRTLEQASAPAAGSRVVVEGNTLRSAA
jgi:outer membrane lipoprotein SlyB